MKISETKRNLKEIILKKELTDKVFETLLKKKWFLIPVEKYNSMLQIASKIREEKNIDKQVSHVEKPMNKQKLKKARKGC